MGVDARSFTAGWLGLLLTGWPSAGQLFGLHLTANLELERTGGIRLFN